MPGVRVLPGIVAVSHVPGRYVAFFCSGEVNMVDHTFSLRVSGEMREKLEQLARQEERSAGSMLRIILKQGLKQRGMIDERAPVTAANCQRASHDAR
jgi:hypothetical protein